jgi:hypothetical protein
MGESPKSVPAAAAGYVFDKAARRTSSPPALSSADAEERVEFCCSDWNALFACVEFSVDGEARVEFSVDEERVEFSADAKESVEF